MNPCGKSKKIEVKLGIISKVLIFIICPVICSVLIVFTYINQIPWGMYLISLLSASLTLTSLVFLIRDFKDKNSLIIDDFGNSTKLTVLNTIGIGIAVLSFISCLFGIYSQNYNFLLAQSAGSLLFPIFNVRLIVGIESISVSVVED